MVNPQTNEHQLPNPADDLKRVSNILEKCSRLRVMRGPYLHYGVSQRYSVPVPVLSSSTTFILNLYCTFLCYYSSHQANGVHWEKIDATRPIESIQDEIKRLAISAIRCVKGKDISPLWPLPEKD